MLATGQKAPEFRLQNHNGQTVTNQELKGSWVVLYFYPRDDTPGCTVEACEFTAGIRDFQKLNARVIGVSPDSVESHAKFMRKHNLSVELLADPEHQMLERYGAWGEKSMYGKKSFGVLRSTVVLDPEGRVAKHWPKVQAAGHAAAVQAALAELQGAAPAATAANSGNDKKAAKKSAKKTATKAAPAKTDKPAPRNTKTAGKATAKKAEKSTSKNASSIGTKPAAKTTKRT